MHLCSLFVTTVSRTVSTFFFCVQIASTGRGALICMQAVLRLSACQAASLAPGAYYRTMWFLRCIQRQHVAVDAASFACMQEQFEQRLRGERCFSCISLLLERTLRPVACGLVP